MPGHNRRMPAKQMPLEGGEPECFALHAWVDESVLVDGPGPGAYVLGAVVADPTSCDGIRDKLRALRRGREPRLHWQTEQPRRRTLIADTVAAMDLAAIVVVGTPVARTAQERARRCCLDRLLFELDQLGVEQVWMEARTDRLNRADLRLVDAARRKGAIPGRLRVDHARPLDEPMLWLPDSVAGAVSASHRGKLSWLATIQQTVTMIRLDLA
jgi:hypothetical protein